MTESTGASLAFQPHLEPGGFEPEQVTSSAQEAERFSGDRQALAVGRHARHVQVNRLQKLRGSKPSGKKPPRACAGGVRMRFNPSWLARDVPEHVQRFVKT